jgi:hypothetical protein
MTSEDLLLCKAKNTKGKWVYGLLIHQDTGYTYALFSENSNGIKYTHPDDVEIKHFTELAIQERTENGRLITHSIIPETLCRFTGMLDIDKKQIFENDVLLTQPYTDKPYSTKAKSKRYQGVVKYIFSPDTNESGWVLELTEGTGKFRHCNWNEFFEAKILGNIFDKINEAVA